MKINIKSLSRPRFQRGDTIIEVLISVTILALVLSITFVSTSRSLRQGDAATNRQQATSYAQQQVELIKNIPPSSASEYSSLSTTQAFVMCTDGSLKLIPTDGSNPCPPSSSFGQYTLNDTYDSSNGLFTINASWPSTASSGASADQLNVYYKVPQPAAFVSTQLMFTSPCNNTTVNAGATCALNWTATNATSCTASGAWSGSQPFSGAQTQNVQVNTTSTYDLSCTNGGVPATGQVVINVASIIPSAPVARLCVDSGDTSLCSPFANTPQSATINSGSDATLTYFVAGTGVSCGNQSTSGQASSLNWANPATAGPVGSATQTALAGPATYNFYLTCNNSGGQDSQTVVVTVNPPGNSGGGGCSNGATNPPACNNNSCSNGATNPPACNNNSCSNGATNPPACNNNSCSNGAINPPTCDTCSNGATNPPACDNNSCSNGATNPPACNNNNTCSNGAVNPPACDTCGNGATNPPACDNNSGGGGNPIGGFEFDATQPNDDDFILTTQNNPGYCIIVGNTDLSGGVEIWAPVSGQYEYDYGPGSDTAATVTCYDGSGNAVGSATANRGNNGGGGGGCQSNPETDPFGVTLNCVGDTDVECDAYGELIEYYDQWSGIDTIIIGSC